MRLPLAARLRPLQRLILRWYEWTLGAEAPGPLIVNSYRKRLFGNAWTRCMQEGMRRATEWRGAEVELFAAFVSRLNSCTY